MRTRALVLAAVVAAATALQCSSGMACVCEENPCETFSCNADKACDKAVLVCDSTHCDMGCGGEQSCAQSHMQCLSDHCTVTCAGEQACSQMATYAATGILSAAASDPVGEEYEMWLSARAGTGDVVCSGEQACKGTAVGCASMSCGLNCTAQHACLGASYEVTSSSKGAAVACTDKQACQQARVDLSSVNGDAELRCTAQQACHQATVVCPASRSLVVHCEGAAACQQLTLQAPAALPKGQQCLLRCVGDAACSGMDKTNLAGNVTVDCTTPGACTDYLLGLSGTAAPTPAPTRECTNWRLKVAGTIGQDCNALCTAVLSASLCSDLCECGDDDTPVPRQLPDTQVPAPLPTTQAPVAVPLPNCTEWVLKAPLGLQFDCDDLCTAVQVVQPLCTQHCVCNDTDSDSPPVDNVTEDPETPVPATAAPGTVSVLKRLFRITLGLLLSLFDADAFTAALLRLLGSLVSGVKVHWTCPASACSSGCPSTAALKLSGGCRALVAKSSARLADMLADTSAGTVLEVSADYTDAGSEAAVNEALQREAASPTELQGFQVQKVVIVTTEVLQQGGGDAGDDDMPPGIIALVVVLSVAAVASIALAAVCCIRRQDAQQHNNAAAADSEMQACEPVAPSPAPRHTHPCQQDGSPYQQQPQPWRP